MPAFLVRFDRPVHYNPGHPKGRPVTELPVRAPSAAKAVAHALRVTQGDAETTVEEVADFVGPPPAVETPPDPPPVVINAAVPPG